MRRGILWMIWRVRLNDEETNIHLCIFKELYYTDNKCEYCNKQYDFSDFADQLYSSITILEDNKEEDIYLNKKHQRYFIMIV